MLYENTNDLTLCTLIKNDHEAGKEKEKEKKVSFAEDFKFKVLHAELLPSSQKTSMMCTVPWMVTLLTKSPKIPGFMVQVPCVISQTLAPVCMMSLILTNQCMAAQANEGNKKK